jgi:hypothetical protein
MHHSAGSIGKVLTIARGGELVVNFGEILQKNSRRDAGVARRKAGPQISLMNPDLRERHSEWKLLFELVARLAGMGSLASLGMT